MKDVFHLKNRILKMQAQLQMILQGTKTRDIFALNSIFKWSRSFSVRQMNLKKEKTKKYQSMIIEFNFELNGDASKFFTT